MPDDFNNIYVDITFSTTADEQKDIDAELTLADADVIGAYNMPVIYRVISSTPAFQSANIDYSISTLLSGIAEQDLEYYAGVLSSGIKYNYIDYDVGTMISGGLDKYVDYFSQNRYSYLRR